MLPQLFTNIHCGFINILTCLFYSWWTFEFQFGLLETMCYRHLVISCLHLYTFFERRYIHLEVKFLRVCLSLALVRYSSNKFYRVVCNLYTQKQFMSIQFFYISPIFVIFSHLNHSGQGVRKHVVVLKLHCLDSYLRWVLFHILIMIMYSFSW